MFKYLLLKVYEVSQSEGVWQGLFSSTWFSTRCQNLVGRCQNSLSDDVTVSELGRTVSELGRTVSELGRTVSELESKL